MRHTQVLIAIAQSRLRAATIERCSPLPQQSLHAPTASSTRRDRKPHPARTLLCRLLLLSVLAARALPAKTLGKLLTDAGIPTASFSTQELAIEVQGAAGSDAHRIVVAYREINRSNMFTGPQHLVGFDKASHRLLRSRLKLPTNGACILSSAPDGLSFFRELTLVRTSLSPSAGCLLILNKTLHLRRVFYGFQAAGVLPDKILLFEDMIHFVPVHPGRLQLADLRTGATLELYPPKDDALRAQLIREHAKRMPPQATCMQMNDPCSPELFNETVLDPVATDGEGRFAFLVTQSADHATQPDTPPEPVVAQTVLYLYQHRHDGWFYCEDKVPDQQLENLSKALKGSLAAVTTHCTPNMRVLPDLSTATYNPFLPTNPGTQPAPR